MKISGRIICIALLLGLWNIDNVVAQSAIISGRDLIHEMHDRHTSQWYRSMCFSQKVLVFRNDSITSEDVWHEAYQSPGNLVIKYSDWDSGNGMLFSKDSLYVFKNGKLAQQIYKIHDLVVLGLDINIQRPEETIFQAEKLGYELSKVEKTKIDGRSYWVVGDTTKLCFWVDENLLFYKMRRVAGSSFREIEFAKYEKIDGKPVATVIKFYNGPGKLEIIEEYFNIRLDCEVPPAIFNPSNFNQARW
ncbi:MAG: hypothetical protein PWR20_1379 [Bacteroidales bacterium]|jgi:hypothetical protein|nr:hypothetical protein [Bacteroidales bacterium]MDN5329337.1 hypothetical protein [Bacteroidales bacterium]